MFTSRLMQWTDSNSNSKSFILLLLWVNVCKITQNNIETGPQRDQLCSVMYYISETSGLLVRFQFVRHHYFRQHNFVKQHT